eukprot:1507528-Pyramimonas_sp.AAC.1
MFLGGLTSKLELTKDELESSYKAGQPDKYFTLLTSAVQDSASEVFTGDAAGISPLYHEQASERASLLRQRSVLRTSLSEACTEEEEENIKNELKEASKQCAKLRRRQMRRWRADATEELEQAWRRRDFKE